MSYYKYKEENEKILDPDLKSEMIRVIKIIYPEKTVMQLNRLSDSQLKGLYGSAVKKRQSLNIPYDLIAPVEEDTLDDYAIPDEEEERRRY